MTLVTSCRSVCLYLQLDVAERPHNGSPRALTKLLEVLPRVRQLAITVSLNSARDQTSLVSTTLVQHANSFVCQCGYGDNSVNPQRELLTMWGRYPHHPSIPPPYKYNNSWEQNSIPYSKPKLRFITQNTRRLNITSQLLINNYPSLLICTSISQLKFHSTQIHNCSNIGSKLKLNSVASVREQTIPTERLSLVGEVSANFCE
jgi:hypothetical protein